MEAVLRVSRSDDGDDANLGRVGEFQPNETTGARLYRDALRWKLSYRFFCQHGHQTPRGGCKARHAEKQRSSRTSNTSLFFQQEGRPTS